MAEITRKRLAEIRQRIKDSGISGFTETEDLVAKVEELAAALRCLAKASKNSLEQAEKRRIEEFGERRAPEVQKLFNAQRNATRLAEKALSGLEDIPG